jgi:hypothetical protein
MPDLEKSDIERVSLAEQAISTNDIDKAWSALYWVFCSTDLEADGFYQTVTRLGINPDHLRTEMLDQYPIAREFWFGSADDRDAVHDELQEA